MTTGVSSTRSNKTSRHRRCFFRSACEPQPRHRGRAEGCELFQDLAWSVSVRPMRSIWPRIAEPWVLLVQLLQVLSRRPQRRLPSWLRAGERVGDGSALSPRPLMTSPLLAQRALLGQCVAPANQQHPWRPPHPLAFCHGPLPMRSRALTAGLRRRPGSRDRRARPWPLRRPPAPASGTDCPHRRGPPRLAPLPIAVAGDEEGHAGLLRCEGAADNISAATATPNDSLMNEVKSTLDPPFKYVPISMCRRQTRLVILRIDHQHMTMRFISGRPQPGRRQGPHPYKKSVARMRRF